ncbi:MAG TPA: hypothetical protein VLI06_06325 [Solimonas sp.]|nr:hypothetical protein [Solimonas sp.]
MSEELQWYEIPARFLSEPGVIRLREPPGADIPELRRQLRDDEYRKPFLFDDGLSRRLHFNLRYVQSQIDLKTPDALPFAYTRRMLGFLLFKPEPQHVVIIGLGGGSLTRWCHRRLPQTRVTTLEIDEQVIAFGEWFELPPPDARMQIVHADAADWFAGTRERADVVLVDGCDDSGTAATFCEEAFYRSLRARLLKGGIVVVNLLGTASKMNDLQKLLGEIFPAVMVVDVRGVGNRVLIAFNERGGAPDWQSVREQAEQLQRRHELEFPVLARQLQYSYRQRRSQPG